MYYLFNYKILTQNAAVQLEELEPLFEPEPVPFSFNTPAWYALGFILIVLAAYTLFLQFKKFKNNRYRRDALKLIDGLNASNQSDINTSLNTIKTILKKLAIHRYGRTEVAALYGMDWLEYLESKAEDTPFSKYTVLIDYGASLTKEPDTKVIAELVVISKKWIKTHA